LTINSLRNALTLLLILIGFAAQAQTPTVTYTASNEPLQKALRHLEKTHDLHFSHAASLLKNKNISVEAEQMPLETFLKTVFDQAGIEHQIVSGKFIVLKAKGAEATLLAAQLVRVDGGPLSFGTVREVGSTNATIADIDGMFRLEVQNSKTALLEVAALGFFTDTLPAASFMENKPVALNEKVYELSHFTVLEYLNDGVISDDAATQITLRAQEVTILPGLAERDVLMTAQMLPGINSTDESPASISIRGSSSDKARLYWNDIVLYHTAHYFGTISAIIPTTVDEVDIYRNYIPSEYGGGLSGLINMRSDHDIPQKLSGSAGLNLTHFDAKLFVPLGKKMGLQVAGRRSYNDVVATPTFDIYSEKLFEGKTVEGTENDSTEETATYEPTMNFVDYTVNWTYKPNEKNAFHINHLFSTNKLLYTAQDTVVQSETDGAYNVQNLGINARWNHDWSETFKSELVTSYTSYSLATSMNESFLEWVDDSTQATTTDTFERTNDLTNLEARLNLTKTFNKKHLLKTGLQYNSLDVRSTYNIKQFWEGDFNESLSTVGQVFAAYTSYAFNSRKNWQLQAGVRAAYFDASEAFNIQPQVNVNYKVFDGLWLKSSFGIYYQYMRSLKDDQFNFTNTTENQWVLSDDDELPIAGNTQVVLGLGYNHKGWLIDLDVYQKLLTGLVSASYQLSSDDAFEFEDGTGTVQGLDFMIRKRWKKYRSWMSYSYSKSVHRFSVNEEPKDFAGFFDRPHQLRWAHTYMLKRWEFSVAGTYKSGLPYTEATGLTFFEEEDDEGYYELAWGEINGKRLPDYLRFDLSVWYKFPTKEEKKWKGTIGFSVLNFTDQVNVWSRTFTVVELDDELETPELAQSEKYLLGLTPNLSFRVDF
jgi:hypothetical protein